MRYRAEHPMTALLNVRRAAHGAWQLLLLLTAMGVKASGQSCVTPSDAARRSVDRFLASPGDSAFRAVHGVTPRNSNALQPLRAGPDSKLCARMNAAFPSGASAAYFRYRGVIIGTDAQEPRSPNG